MNTAEIQKYGTTERKELIGFKFTDDGRHLLRECVEMHIRYIKKEGEFVQTVPTRVPCPRCKGSGMATKTNAPCGKCGGKKDVPGKAEAKYEPNEKQKAVLKELEAVSAYLLHTAPIRRGPLDHIGRNDPCPCASGKRFKKCCGKEG